MTQLVHIPREVLSSHVFGLFGHEVGGLMLSITSKQFQWIDTSIILKQMMSDVKIYWRKVSLLLTWTSTSLAIYQCQYDPIDAVLHAAAVHQCDDLLRFMLIDLEFKRKMHKSNSNLLS